MSVWPAADSRRAMGAPMLPTPIKPILGITVMVWEDKAYGLIAWKQEAEFGRHTDLAFGNPDWMKLAESFGWNGHWVANSRDFASTLRTALDEEGPSLVVIPIDYRENPLLTERLGAITCPI